ncbi:MAG: hypothetical protein NTW29_14560 [Bacteroidetes bacterium]|nr:hypothetical protein [Bacteroidota bacterium]
MKRWMPVVVLLFMLSACKAQQAPECEYRGGGADYLERIGCPQDFAYIQGKPLSERFGKAQSLKIVYSIAGNQLYFTNSGQFPFHFDFCVKVLNAPDNLELFNRLNYSDNPRREYILCNLNYYAPQDVYALELMAEDDLAANALFDLYKKIVAHTYFGSRIKILVNSPDMQARLAGIPQMPVIQADEIYKGRKFVSLNKGVSYGYLRKVDIKGIENTSLNKHDIVILNGLPNQLPVVAGVMSVPFQTPLCHISLLCINRGTPNATFRNAWTDPAIAQLENKLVYYEVTADTFIIRAANEKDASAYWQKADNRKPIVLSVDTSVKKLVDLSVIGFKEVKLVGGKAANFAELLKIKVDKKPLPLPEGSFAIPFYYYYQHLQQHHILPMLDSLFNNSALLSDSRATDAWLKKIRSAIKAAPLDKTLAQAVISRMQHNGLAYTNYRFRSSTNAEDVKGFNGAGLYESKTGSLDDADKPVEKAIKAVWASLWDERAFAEREFFHIDQHSVAMGILVHRGFGEELANGVAVTKHLYRKNYPAYTINVQKGEVSVVTPPDSVSCDEAIIGLGEVTGNKQVEVEYIGRSSLSPEATVLTNDQLKLLTRYLTAIKEHFFYRVDRSGPKDMISFWNYGMDVEFKIDKFTGNLYIKQARSL